MAVLRQLNLLSQQRLDIPHIRSLESSIAADFDVVTGRITTGGQAVVVRGFVLGNLGSGVSATALQLSTADGVIANLNASEAGTFLWIPSDRAVEVLNPATNGRVIGSWTPGQVNYVGIDFVRASDATTTDLVQFLDANTLLETPKQVPLARTLDYRIVISTVPFSGQPNLVPITKITLNSASQVTAAVDARPLLFRLGSGGDSPQADFNYLWPQGRTESVALNSTLFAGGDKALTSQRDWMQAVMTRIWEIGGGEYWYSATADRNVNMIWTGTPFTNGENFEWDGTNLHWKGLRFLFDNSTGYFNDVADQLVSNPGQTNLADGECVYVDLVRSSNATGLVLVKTLQTTLGPGDPPGSRQVVAWRSGANIFTRGWRYAVGTTGTPATTTSLGLVKLSRTATTPLQPIVISDTGGTIVAPINVNGLTITTSGVGVALTATGGINVLAGSTGRGIQGQGIGSGGIGGWFYGNGTGYSIGVDALGEGTGPGVRGVANATGHGGEFNGGTSVGYGLVAFGTWANATGLAGYGGIGTYVSAPNGTGVFGYGSAAGGHGVYGQGNASATNARGVMGQGKGLEAGVFGQGETGSNGVGVEGVGGGNQAGVFGIGGPTNGVGFHGWGGGVNRAGTGVAVHGEGGQTGTAPTLTTTTSLISTMSLSAGILGEAQHTTLPTVGIVGKGNNVAGGIGIIGYGGSVGGYGVLAFGGGTNGTGLYAEGGSTGNAIIARHSVFANITPIFQAQDSQGDRRWRIGRAGFPGGRINIIETTFQLSDPSNVVSVSPEGYLQGAPGWMRFRSGSGSLLAGTEGVNPAFYLGSSGAAAVHTVFTKQPLFQNGFLNDTVFVGEWDAGSATSAKTSVCMGLGNAFHTTYTDVPDNFMGFLRQATVGGVGVGNNDYLIVTRNGGAAYTTHATVTLTPDVPHRFRLELWGSQTAAGSVKVHFYIDDVLVYGGSSQPANIMLGWGDVYFGFGVNAKTGAGGDNLNVYGTVLLQWNRWRTNIG